MHEFTQTDERSSILLELETSQASLERAANLLRKDYPHRSRRILNHAQSVASTRELLAYDWHDEDRERAA